MSVNSRKVGNAYELSIRKEMIELGWEECQTSRYASKMLDDAKVDLAKTDPFNIQCKRWTSAPSYHTVLDQMPKDTNYNVIVHKRPHKGEVVVMSKADFYEILEMLIKNKIIKTK